MLGRDIQAAFADIELMPFTRAELDVTDLARTREVVKGAKPDLVIHSAAFTDVDGSESDFDRALLVNGTGTRNVAMACEEAGCPVVYISSDYVFDGTKGSPYEEWDRTQPVNRYGYSKFVGEQCVTSMTSRYYIIRTSWLYGQHGKNFVDTIVDLLKKRDSLDVVNDQTGSPTYTVDLAAKLRELPGKGYGIYHFTNSSDCSWYDLAVEIARLKGSSVIINPVDSSKFPRPAKRPAYSVLNSSMMRLEGFSEFRHWRDALAEYLRS